MKAAFLAWGWLGMVCGAFAGAPGGLPSPQGGGNGGQPPPVPMQSMGRLMPQSAREIGAVYRTVSQSGQFVVYCQDVRLRLAVASFSEALKGDVLEMLKVGDHWKMPVVLDLRQPSTTEPQRWLSQVRLVETDGGWRVEVNVRLREGELKQVGFPQLVVRAILLELAYRNRPPEVGKPYMEPPSWLVGGMALISERKARDKRPDAELFRQLIETGKLPPIGDFLRSNVAAMDPVSLRVHDMYAASLLNLLLGLPGGSAGLSRMVRGVPDSGGDPVGLLLKNFPALGGSETSLEKWWTLGLAKTSISDGEVGLSVAETDARLAALLRLSLVTDEKAKTRMEFELEDYKKFLKLPGARLALAEKAKQFSLLMGQTHPAMWGVVKEYLQVMAMLSRGKTRGVDKALKKAAEHRALIVGHMDKIADYLNWYEATQMPEVSGEFSDYLQSAKRLEKQPAPKRDDAISRYIDQLEREFE